MTADWRVNGQHFASGEPNLSSHEEVTRALDKIEAAHRESAARRPRMGSAMSDRQIARAAVDGRKLEFRTGVMLPVAGYVVGMDDYYWFVAEPSGITLDGEDVEEHGVQPTLVHKSCALVTFTDEYLEGELDEDRQRIRSIGRPFWEWCVTQGLARAPKEQEQQ